MIDSQEEKRGERKETEGKSRRHLIGQSHEFLSCYSSSESFVLGEKRDTVFSLFVTSHLN